MTKPKDSVLRDLYACFLANEAVPKALSDAFVERYLRGRNGEIRSWDEVFGPPARYGTGDRFKRRIAEEQLVVDEVERLKAEGTSRNEEQFEAIGRRLKGLNAGKSKVKELLRDARLWAERMNFLYPH